MHNFNYYDQNADEFIAATLHVNMDSLYQPFLDHLVLGARILDLGCGSGRDSLAFIQKGYCVDAMDYSKALVKQATALTGLQVRYASFYDLAESDQYDGVWACASLLHCKRDKLPDVLHRIHHALRCTGICYMSFKYGSTDRLKDGRAFTDLNEEQAQALLQQLDGALVLKQWITVDQRPDRDEKWLNILWKKQ